MTSMCVGQIHFEIWTNKLTSLQSPLLPNIEEHYTPAGLTSLHKGQMNQVRIVLSKETAQIA